MTTQGDRQNYKWRPNDYSSTTLSRYDQEAEHWVKAFNNARTKNKTDSLTETLREFGFFISIIFSLASLIIMVIIHIIKWLRSNK